MSADPVLLAKAEQIRDATIIGENTALRVGGLLVDLVNALGGNVDSLTAVADYLMHYNAVLTNNDDDIITPDRSHVIDLHQSRIVLLDSMGLALDGEPYTLQVGDVYYDNGFILVKTGGGATGYAPKAGVLYINKITGKFYEWDGVTMSELQNIGGRIDIVNDLTTGGADKALSAQMGILLKSNINAVQDNLNRLYNKLANMAFWDSQDQEDAEPLPLDWSVEQVIVTITNGIGAGSVIKHNGTAVNGTLQVDQGDPLTLTIEPNNEDYVLNNVTATVGGAAATLSESGGVYTLAIAHVNASTTIVISGSAVFSWPTAPKTNETDGQGNVTRYGMQQGRSIYAGYGAVTGGLVNNTPAVIMSPAGLPLDTFIFTTTNVMGGHQSTNPGRATNCFLPTGGKRYLNVRLIDSGTMTGYEYKLAVGAYGDAVINNAQADHFYSAMTTIDGQKGRINYALPNSTEQDGSMYWKIDLSAQEQGITYVKLLVAKYPQGNQNAVDSRTWFNDMTLQYKFTDD